MKNSKIFKMNFFKLPVAWAAIFCFTSTNTIQAQDVVRNHSDSLLLKVHQAPTTDLKIEALLNVSNFWIDYDTIKAKQYLEEAYELMDKPATDFQKGLYHLYRANIWMDYKPEKAKTEYQLADRLLANEETPKAYLYRSRLWNNYGVFYKKKIRVPNLWKSLSTKPFLLHVKVAIVFKSVINCKIWRC